MHWKRRPEKGLTDKNSERIQAYNKAVKIATESRLLDNVAREPNLAEVLRLKGWMPQQQGKLAAADENYIASVDVAREQQAKSWELRTSTDLARLWQSQGKRKEALDLLKPVYDWFTEGFDTKDLIKAKALLEELA